MSRLASGSGNMLQFGEGSDTFMTVRSDSDNGSLAQRGYVGIGTTSPDYNLHVNGSVASTSFVNLSDARLKSEVQGLAYGLNEVLKLRPVTYRWSDPVVDGKLGTQVGFIAQEVEDVIPELVSTATDEAGTKSVSYAQMTAVLVNAVKELTEEVSNLKAENLRLSGEIENLKSSEK